MFSYFSTYSPPELRHSVGSIFYILCRRSLLPRIGINLFQNTEHSTLCTDIVCFNFALQGDPLWRQCSDCFLVSVVMCATHVSSPVIILSRNSLPSSRYRYRNVNADSMLFDLSSGVSCYALCVQNFMTHGTSQPAGTGIWVSIFNRCNCAIVRTREVPLVHASCDVLFYYVHPVASRDKRFISFGTSGKLTLWTPLVFRLAMFSIYPWNLNCFTNLFPDSLQHAEG